MVVSPMGLDEHAVDLLEVNGLVWSLMASSRQAMVRFLAFTDDALGGADDESQGVRSEGVVAEPGLVQFAEDPGLHVVRGDFGHDDGIGDAGLDVGVGDEADVGQTDRGQPLRINMACLSEEIIFVPAWIQTLPSSLPNPNRLSPSGVWIRPAWNGHPKRLCGRS